LCVETSSISSGKAVAQQARPPLPDCDRSKLPSRLTPFLNNALYI
jgi:hypothetical protein